LEEIRNKRDRLPLLPFAIVLCLAGLGMAVSIAALGHLYPLVGLILVGLSIGAVVLSHKRDELQKTVVVLYDFEPQTEEAYKLFCGWAAALGGSKGLWRIDATGDVANPKYTAGAGTLVFRTAATLFDGAPAFLRTNVPVYRLSVGRNMLYFLPDRMLICRGSETGAVTYASVDVTVRTTSFIEDGPLPRDAAVTGHTWRYLNKGGEPDRRFSNNAQLPICAYDELHLRTATGLDERLQVSRPGMCEGFAAAIRHLARIGASTTQDAGCSGLNNDHNVE
jgi:hypothetical protein